MIQEIGNHTYDLYYKNIEPRENDYVLCFKEGKAILNSDKSFLRYKDLYDKKVFYGFMVDEIPYFISLTDPEKYEFPINIFRELDPRYLGFILITGYHLFNFYNNNKYCGKCGNELVHSDTIRSLKCSCGNEVFPTIAPAVIIGLLNKNHTKIMLTKYINGKNYALVAGYNEIGETLEDTVRREVKEEVGLNVKNIKYYKSQPWGLSGSVLSGFWADVNDDFDEPVVETDELNSAEWFEPKEIMMSNDGVSLTREMIEYFKNGNDINL